jgi:hypothetical protein
MLNTQELLTKVDEVEKDKESKLKISEKNQFLLDYKISISKDLKCVGTINHFIKLIHRYFLGKKEIFARNTLERSYFTHR